MTSQFATNLIGHEAHLMDRNQQEDFQNILICGYRCKQENVNLSSFTSTGVPYHNNSSSDLWLTSCSVKKNSAKIGISVPKIVLRYSAGHYSCEVNGTCIIYFDTKVLIMCHKYQ